MKRPAVVAGLVGLGVAVVVVIGFELVFAVQAIVFLLALPVGLLIGWYANAREHAAQVLAAAQAGDRGASSPVRVGWMRALGNGLVAGVITAVALAVLYVLIRLLFFYLDTGFRAGGPPLDCASGPVCGYQRALAEPSIRAALESAGVHDADGYAAFFLEGQAIGGGALLVLVVGGSLAGAVAYRLTSSRPTASTIAHEGTP